MDWLDAIRQLPPHRILVEHQPETDRYARARQKLRHLVQRSEFLGATTVNEAVTEIAVWVPPNSGGRSGYYACFRAPHKEGEVLSAILYCFYDGTDGSPSITSKATAIALAIAEGFLEGE